MRKLQATANVTALFLLLCLPKSLAGGGGGCMGYGHSCWGGHGKRSSVRQYDSSHVAKPPDWLLKGVDLRTLLSGINSEYEKVYKRNGHQKLSPPTNVFKIDEPTTMQRELKLRPRFETSEFEMGDLSSAENTDVGLDNDVLLISSTDESDEPSKFRIYNILNQDVLKSQSAG